MPAFATFALLYMTALFLELAEKWAYPLFTLTILGLVLLILSTRITHITFLIFLAVTTAHFLLVQFPDVANHVNIAIYANVVMTVGIIYSQVRHDFPTDDAYFAMMRPLLQVTAILVYFLAGFHKLNADFFDPDVSCVGNMVNSLAKVATSDVFGIPAGLLLLAGISAIAYGLVSSSPIRAYLPTVAGVGAILLAIVAVLLVLNPAPEIPPLAITLVMLAMAIAVIAWELIGGPLLAVSRLQAPLLAFSWTMHSTLALIGFVDFASLALSLLFVFVPQPYLALINSPLRVPGLGLTLHRAYLYVFISVLSGIASGLDRPFIAGILFNLAALVFIWPVLSTVATRSSGLAWVGVPLSRRLTPGWMFIFPALLLLHGLTSYLGLRTAGNFSMFSNLRTEGPVSNHFLLSGNPLKLWSYQEDVVRFIEIDDRLARIGYQYKPLKGNQLPLVEFRKLIYAWTMAGSTIPMRFEHRGTSYTTEDIVNDPVWRTSTRDWEMVLMDFRVIQPDGPNQCRW